MSMFMFMSMPMFMEVDMDTGHGTCDRGHRTWEIDIIYMKGYCMNMVLQFLSLPLSFTLVLPSLAPNEEIGSG